MTNNWLKEFSAAITVCDVNGKIIDMNNKSDKVYSEKGGYQLIGKNLFDYHNENSIGIIKDLLATGKNNVYTVEKNGIKKLIYHAPWYEDGKVKGLVELMFEIPLDMPNHVK